MKYGQAKWTFMAINPPRNTFGYQHPVIWNDAALRFNSVNLGKTDKVFRGTGVTNWDPREEEEDPDFGNFIKQSRQRWKKLFYAWKEEQEVVQMVE